MVEDRELLMDFACEGSQEAFTQLVQKYVNLVYSAALRQVREPHLAEEISQTVFINLARQAGRLAPDTILAAWLYQVTRNAAVDLIRRESARRAREQIAFEMSAQNDSSEASWMEIAPYLDEAMDALASADRTALLLRYFENKSLREVGEALGASEDAAQKKVARALDRLGEVLKARQVAIGASALAMLISTNAVQSAPASLAVTITTGSVAAAGVSTIGISKSIALTMTTTQKAVLAIVIAAGAITVGIQTRQASSLHADVQSLRDQSAGLSNEVRHLTAERDEARQQIAALRKENAARTAPPTDTLKLRGEVSQLREQKRELGATSGLSKVTANPETKRIMREQQKMGMSAIFGRFGKIANLTPEQSEKFNDLLADHIMDDIESVTTALRQKLSPDQADRLFSASEADLNAKVRELVGDEGFAKFQQYSGEVLGNVTGYQFKAMMGGDDAAKDKKAEEMAKIINEEGRAAITAANLPKDYQLLPMMNLRNIASETEGEKSVQLLDSVFTRALDRLGDVLSKDEIEKFRDLKAKAVANNRAALAMNRNLMAPIGE